MSFTSFHFHAKIAAAIKDCGYASATPIQLQAIPPVLAGRDLLGLAQTGTGKTAAFVLPILQRLMTGPRKKVRALIVAPTRELAEQTHEYIGKMAGQTGLASAVVYGGVGKQGQIRQIRSGAEIIVACPGRLLDHLDDGAFHLNNLEMLVLDEADHMFDKGFLPAIRRILKYVPKQRQTLIFSATMPDEIRHLAQNILQAPETVQINHDLPAPTISHVLFQVEQQSKTALLKQLIEQTEMVSALIFTRTKHKAKTLAMQLEKSGLSVTSLQGNLSQQKRQQALDGFKSGKFKILVATDIAARGIDVSRISHVVNYDMPDTAETYTHRTGRTGRACRTGEAFTFAGREDMKMIQLIERNLGKKMARPASPAIARDALTDHAEMRAERPARVERKSSHGPSRSAGAGNQQRRRAVAFDFDVRSLSQGSRR
ncbi:MAG: DEAD/DEAH box helicase [Desulfurivibrio sp.]|nr:MAG: DEAD/DEAH box helicase [Desulfurivibrio sp.]